MYSNRIQHEVQYQVHAIIFNRAVPYVITLSQFKCWNGADILLIKIYLWTYNLRHILIHTIRYENCKLYSCFWFSKFLNLPGNPMYSAFMFLSFRIWTSFLHWVDFPALSQPSKTIRAPLLQFGPDIVFSNEQVTTRKFRSSITDLNKLSRARCMNRKYYRKECKYDGRSGKWSAPKLHPWCLVVAESTPKRLETFAFKETTR